MNSLLLEGQANLAIQHGVAFCCRFEQPLGLSGLLNCSVSLLAQHPTLCTSALERLDDVTLGVEGVSLRHAPRRLQVKILRGSKVAGGKGIISSRNISTESAGCANTSEYQLFVQILLSV